MDKQLEALLSNEKYIITLLANSSAYLNEQLDNINWLGFYLYQDDQLILGPFQGKIACEIIQLNKGVCGKCASERKTIVVDNVHKFPGHIACDSASNSELVIPIIVNNQLYGLLDIDSPSFSRFDDAIVNIMQKCVKVIENKLNELL